jgi:hypothetical protein
MRKARRKLSLEEEYERMQSSLDIEHWEQRRVPRPDGEDD